MLSIDGTFLVMLLSFVIFMVLMKSIYFGPILSIKQEREATIESGRQASDDAANKSLKLSQEYDQHLNEARRKAQQLIQEKRQWAKNNAASHLTKAREDATHSYDRQASQLREAQERVYQELQPQREALAQTIIAKLSERQKSAAGT